MVVSVVSIYPFEMSMPNRKFDAGEGVLYYRRAENTFVTNFMELEDEDLSSST